MIFTMKGCDTTILQNYEFLRTLVLFGKNVTNPCPWAISNIFQENDAIYNFFLLNIYDIYNSQTCEPFSKLD